MLFSIFPALLLGWALVELFDDGSSSSSGGGGGGQEGDEITGDAGDNILTGDEGNNLIIGLGGDDTLDGGEGDDGMLGGEDDDILLGGVGDDILRGEAGNDLLVGGEGDDTVLGSGGQDWVEGDAGDDTLRGGVGSDILLGGTGVDTLEGGTNGDVLFGGSVTGTPLTTEQLTLLRNGTPLATVLGVDGDTTLASLVDDGEADVLSGEVGDDTLILGAGDKAAGGAGDDSFLVLASQAAENTPASISDFSEGDSVSVIVDTSPEAPAALPTVTVQDDGEDALVLADGAVIARVAGAAGDLTADDIELVTGPTINDIDPAVPQNIGQEEADVNEQTLTAEADTFTAEEGNIDLINAAAGDDTVDGGDLRDVLRGAEGDDILIGGTGNDELLGDEGSDLMQGNAGNDKLLGGQNDDWLNGGEGDDVLIANAGNDVVIGGDGADDIRGNNNQDFLIGGDLFAAELTQEQLIAARTSGELPEGLTPGALDDGDVDVMDGGSGDDILIGANGDQLTGGDGNDLFMAYDNSPAAAVVVNDFDADDDSLAVIYDAGETAPVITVTDSGDGVFTILADGTPVAVVASADATITAEDVSLIERATNGSVPAS